MIQNLLQETIHELKLNEKTPEDVEWVGNDVFKCTWENFAKVANMEYDDERGNCQIADDLIVVGKDFWLERDNDGRIYYWNFIPIPTSTGQYTELKAVNAPQAKENGLDVWWGETLLNRLNGVEKRENI